MFYLFISSKKPKNTEQSGHEFIKIVRTSDSKSHSYNTPILGVVYSQHEGANKIKAVLQRSFDISLIKPYKTETLFIKKQPTKCHAVLQENAFCLLFATDTHYT